MEKVKRSRKECIEQQTACYEIVNDKVIETRWYTTSNGYKKEKTKELKLSKFDTYVIWDANVQRQAKLIDGELIFVKQLNNERSIINKQTYYNNLREEYKKKIQERQDRRREKLINSGYAPLVYNGYTSNKYFINRESDIVSIFNGESMSQFDSFHGYKIVSIDLEFARETIYVHRAMGFTFLEEVIGCPEINHIDLDKANNRIENLEWVTRLENMRHFHSLVKNRTYKSKNKNNQ